MKTAWSLFSFAGCDWNQDANQGYCGDRCFRRGVEALQALVRQLPADFAAAVLVVLHIPNTSTSVLPNILSRAGSLPSVHAEEGMGIHPGKIYVAPPGLHLGLSDSHARLSHGPRENNVRPSIDYLFRSAARTQGPRVIGVVLSGLLYDGAAGLVAIKQHGGLAVVQDPEDAVFSSMPNSALKMVNADAVLPVSEIARYLVEQVGRPVEPQGVQGMDDDKNKIEKRIEKDLSYLRDGQGNDLPILVTCPECGGILWELRDGELVEYECYIGHRYMTGSLLSAKSNELEDSLWTAVRILEERGNLSERLANQAHERNNEISAARFMEQAQDARRSADAVRQVITNTQLDMPEEGNGSEPASNQPSQATQ